MTRIYLLCISVFVLFSCTTQLDITVKDSTTNSPQFNFLIKSDLTTIKSQSPYSFQLYVSQLDFTNKVIVYRFIPSTTVDGYFTYNGKVYQKNDWINIPYSSFVNSLVSLSFTPTEKVSNSVSCTITINMIDTNNQVSTTQAKSFIISL